MTHIEQRIDEAAVLASVNPTPHRGEAVHESDTGRWKIGDGVSAYNALPYKSGVDSVAGHTGEVTLSIEDVDGAIGADSPVLTGTPKTPTRATSDDSTNIASTAFVKAALSSGLDPFIEDTEDALALKAPLASPVFTGNPTAPTPTAGDKDTSIATTAFVANSTRLLTRITTASDSVVVGDIIWATSDDLAVQNRAVRLTVSGQYDPPANGTGAFFELQRSVDGGAFTARATFYMVCLVDFREGFTFSFVDAANASGGALYKYRIRTAAHLLNGGFVTAGSQFTVEDLGPI